MYEVMRRLIYPNKCMVCSIILPPYTIGLLCNKCYSHVLRNHLCPKCGRPYHTGNATCIYCKQEEMKGIEQMIALFPYTDCCRKAVLRWKYKGIRKYARGYADLFVNDLCVLEKLQIDGLVPVPLAPNRQRKRGFNQSLDLAKEISKLTSIPVYDCLVRNKNTKPQSECTKKERSQNIKGSIELKKADVFPELRQIAIIDDIYTTGATVKECIKVIRQEIRIKNEKIYLLIVCIGI